MQERDAPQALEDIIKSTCKGAPCILKVFIIFSQGLKQANRLIYNRLRLQTN